MSEQLQAQELQTENITTHLHSMNHVQTGYDTSALSPVSLDLSAHWLKPKTPPTKRYEGTPETCCSFLTFCSLTFELQPFTFGMFQNGIYHPQTHKPQDCMFDHTVRFCILAAKSQWNDKALAETFFLSLIEEIKDGLTTVNLITVNLTGQQQTA